MKNVCKNLKQHATKIINYEKKEMLPLTKEKRKLYIKQKVCHIWKKKEYRDCKKLEITVVTLEYIEARLIVSVI